MSARIVTSPIKKKTAEHLAWNASSVECAAAVDPPPLQFLSNFKRPEDPLNFVGIKTNLDPFKLTPRLMIGGFRHFFFF